MKENIIKMIKYFKCIYYYIYLKYLYIFFIIKIFQNIVIIK